MVPEEETFRFLLALIASCSGKLMRENTLAFDLLSEVDVVEGAFMEGSDGFEEDSERWW